MRQQSELMKGAKWAPGIVPRFGLYATLAHFDPVDALKAREPSIVAINLPWSLTDDGIKRIGPEFDGGSLLGLIFVVVVNAVGDVALAGSAVIEDALTNIFGDAKPAHVCARRTPEIVHRYIRDAKPFTGAFHGLGNTARGDGAHTSLPRKHELTMTRILDSLSKQRGRLRAQWPTKSSIGASRSPGR